MEIGVCIVFGGDRMWHGCKCVSWRFVCMLMRQRGRSTSRECLDAVLWVAGDALMWCAPLSIAGGGKRKAKAMCRLPICKCSLVQARRPSGAVVFRAVLCVGIAKF